MNRRRSDALLAAALVCVAGSAAGAGAVIEVDQVNQVFSTRSLRLPLGSVVHFLNRDDVTHNISIIDENDVAQDEGLQHPGVVITATFARPGRFVVRCSIHPRMRMVIVAE